MNAAQIITELLDGDHWVQQILGEASVHRPRRGRIWVATFTGPVGGQAWKSTGTADYHKALAIARALEAAARAQRARSAGAPPKPRLRHARSPGSVGGGWTQAEVAALLGISERAVRAIERRALRKLARHPDLPEIWRQYLAGELTEERLRLSPAEIEALLELARSQAEWETIRKVLAFVEG